MKPLVSMVALLLGLGALAATVTIQQNRLAFTRLHRPPPSAELRIPARAVALPVSIEGSAVTPTATIKLDDVIIEGRLPTRARDLTRMVNAAEKTVFVSVPCQDGQYRKLDERGGVRLMCPGGSLDQSRKR